MRLTTLIVATTIACHAVAAPIPDPPLPIALPNVGGAVNDLSDTINFVGGIGNLERRDQLGETANDLVKGVVGTANRFVGGIGNLERRRMGSPWSSFINGIGNAVKSITGRANGPLVKKGNVKITDGIGNLERRQWMGRFDDIANLRKITGEILGRANGPLVLKKGNVKITDGIGNLERRLFRVTGILKHIKGLVGKRTKKGNVKTTDGIGNLERCLFAHRFDRVLSSVKNLVGRDLFGDTLNNINSIVKGSGSNPLGSLWRRVTDNSKQTFVGSDLDLASAQASLQGAIEKHKEAVKFADVRAQAESAADILWLSKLKTYVRDPELRAALLLKHRADSWGNARRSQDTLSAADVDAIKALASAKATEFKSSVEHLQKIAPDLDTVSDPVDLSNIIVDTLDTAASAVANGGLLSTLESLLTPGSAVSDLISGVLNAIGSILGLPDVVPPDVVPPGVVPSGVVPSGVVPSGVVPPGVAPSGVSPPGTDSTLVDKIASNPQLLAAINEKVAGISA